MEKNEVVENIKHLKELPNAKLVEIMDILSNEFENTKTTIINQTHYLDKLEIMYNTVLKEYEERTNL
jgi:hypothetical protein